MNPKDEFFSKEHRYSLGTDLDSGKHYASVPVSIGVADYDEYYELAPQQYARLLADPCAAIAFIDECRKRQHDDLLLQEPGWNRGTPT